MDTLLKAHTNSNQNLRISETAHLLLFVKYVPNLIL